MSSLARKKHEDLNFKKLRELVTLPHNKKCFDCTQRGPTYVNMTIGAFVCTSCSGFLRGLNPPHRVKSISMASFNDQEIVFLQNHGNQVCHNTWYALWNSAGSPEPESKDEHKLKEFLSEKYEKKRWYSSKPKVTTTQQEPEAKPLKTLLGENAPKVFLRKQTKDEKPAMISSPAQRNQPASKSNMDLLGDLGTDPFGSTSQQSRDIAFATFQQPSQPQNQQQQHQRLQQHQPFFEAFSNSSNNNQSNSFDLFSNKTSNTSQQQSNLFYSSSNQQNAFQQKQASNSNTDRYAALADLSLFKNDSTQSVFSGSSVFNEGPSRDYNNQSNGQPNPFMSPGTSSSGAAVFQQQQQKPQNPFQTNDTTSIFENEFRSNNSMPIWPTPRNNVNGSNSTNNFTELNSASQFSKGNTSSNQNSNIYSTNSNQFQSQPQPNENFETNNFPNQPFSSQYTQDVSRQQQAFSGNQFSNANSNAQFNFQPGVFPVKQNLIKQNASNAVPSQSNNLQVPPQNSFNTQSNITNQFQNFNTQQNFSPFAEQPHSFSASFNNQRNSNIKNPPFGGVQLPGFNTQQSTQQSFGTWNQHPQPQQQQSMKSTNPFM